MLSIHSGVENEVCMLILIFIIQAFELQGFQQHNYYSKYYQQ